MTKAHVSDFPPSKSIYNRALILQSFYKELVIKSASHNYGDDVLYLQRAIESIDSGATDFHCGSGAAPLKFLAIRLSRLRGAFTLRGSERLFSRPMNELHNILKGLGASDIVFSSDSLSFTSNGEWPRQLVVNPSLSSQELSAVILSSWDLENEMLLDFSSAKLASSSYLEMTLSMVKAAGWSASINNVFKDQKLLLPKKQQFVLDEIFVEPDMSCVTAYVLAVVLKSDSVRLSSMLADSIQGDFVIFQILRDIGYSVRFEKEESPSDEGVLSELPELRDIIISKGEFKKGLAVNLFSVPDLFPVLSSFCVSLDDVSVLDGLENLNSKESKRLDRICELFHQLGVKYELKSGQLKIYPQRGFTYRTLNFDPDQDHRLAMAAEILRRQGANINILEAEVVSKSFPNYWGMIKSI